MKRGDVERLRSSLRKLAGVEVRLRRSLSEDAAAIDRFAATFMGGQALSSDERAADAFLQRFEQMFEILLRRVFPATVRVVDVAESGEGLLNILNRLEGLRYIDNAHVWVLRKELRDRLIHEYPDEPAERAADLRAAIDGGRAMLGELEQFRDRLATVPGEWNLDDRE